MPSKTRPDPVIPDHEILRKIGGGAYGEVWLGRGVTGALRAVKVVWREDFDDARGFEREFEGILKFEPISRDHPGLVHILHVGRSPDSTSFYYYVMELGDDVRSGQDINPIEYEPRTLRADTKQAMHPQLDTATCIDVGLRLSEALDHLHERGLAHRDVKPSNVIFLNGRAKLADIGLVAARDQRTFVGTEGFVPPEGPGSAQADVYSLGKVLYEIATGKDRLDFPELPDTLPTGTERKRWLELNKIICDICEPRLSKRMITTASGLAEELKRLQRGKRRRRPGTAVWATTLLLLGFSAWAGYQTWKSGHWEFPWQKVTPPVVEKMGKVKVISTPEGADVTDEHGNNLGKAPTGEMEVKPGEKVRYTISKAGYTSKTIEAIVPEEAIERALYLRAEIRLLARPEIGQVWEDHLENVYQPVGEKHVSAGYASEKAWKKFLFESKRPSNDSEIIKINNKKNSVVMTTKDGADAFCDWLRVESVKQDYLTEDDEVVADYDLSFQDPAMAEAKNKELRPFRMIVGRINYGMIRLSSDPPGAEVYIDGKARGLANGIRLIDKVKPGVKNVLLVMEGYDPLTLSPTVIPGEVTNLEEQKLKRNDENVVFGQPWKNSLGMKFAPLGKDLMVSAWETRVKDYAEFVKRTRHVPARDPEFQQKPESPVVYVNREDAIAFCEWLTQVERGKKLISPSHSYRLPTDMEWSQMAELSEEEGRGPDWRDARKSKVFPWGVEWPPQAGYGNYADGAAALSPGVSIDSTIQGYDDTFAYTSPVGSFPANGLGIFDLSGNVQEWVSDDYFGLDNNKLGILRGGGWSSYTEDSLYTGTRNFQPPTFADKTYGFRVVLWKRPQEEDVPNPLDDPEAPAN